MGALTILEMNENIITNINVRMWSLIAFSTISSSEEELIKEINDWTAWVPFLSQEISRILGEI
jgi:hypothetical protein